MQFEVKEVDSFKRKITVKVTPEELTPIEARLLKKYQKSVTLPGFRKGKVPINLVKKTFAEALQGDLIEEAIQTFYGLALEESKLEPVSQGVLNNVDFKEVQSGLEFEIELEVEPEVELKKYKGLKVEKELLEVTEEMIDEALENMRESLATVRPVDEVVEDSLVTFSAQELGEGDAPIIGRKYENLVVTIGRGEFDEEFEKQMIGLKPGDEAIVRKTNPPEPGKEDLLPVVESYKITIEKVEMRELPELNDEFVKNLNDEKLETLDQLRERFRENLQHRLDHQVEDSLQTSLVDELLKENPFEVPDSMVENYLRYVISDLKEQYKDQKIDEDIVRTQYRAEAIHAVRWMMLRQKLIEAENIEVADEEVQARIDELPYSEEQKEQIRKDEDWIRRMRNDLLEKKVLKFLEEHADIEIVKDADAAAEKIAQLAKKEE